jgi:hypothetical protein
MTESKKYGLLTGMILTAVFLASTGCKTAESPQEDTVPDAGETLPVAAPQIPAVTAEPLPEADPQIIPVSATVPQLPFHTEWTTFEYDDVADCGYFFISDELPSLSMIEGEFSKDSGYEGGCFGFIFAYTIEKTGRLTKYIRFEINTRGEYAVYSYDNGIYTDLVESQPEDKAYLYPDNRLVAGYGKLNTLRIEKSEDGSASVYINGSLLVSGIALLPDSSGGFMSFCSVGKKTQENLPAEPVKVNYRITTSQYS